MTRVFDKDILVTPATAARKNNALYVVNAKFFTPDEDASTQTYEVVRIDRDEADSVCWTA